MKAENWKSIKDVLLQVLNLDASARRGFLDKADISFEIRSEVESLLAFETESEDLMRLSAMEFSKDFFGAERDRKNVLIGQRVGVYEIVGELGQGGMGAVYLASRTDGKFAQRVAVKMLKRELNTERIRRNFTREKEILATLAHPNIAALLDAGTTADGVPYLVMEYVEGEPIDIFCRKNALSLNERLKLFNRVCEAVAFAHRNLIVHRDLKPSNILVTKNGAPKLLDFGISKLLAAESDDEHAITNRGAMTPEYASPEQIKGEPVTTETDIYSLGVVLFKILTETYPYNFKNKSNGNLLKEITDSEPTLPSAAASIREVKKDIKGKTEISHSSVKIASPPRLPFSSSRLKGDLDNIILKSLSKEPERRYQTAEQFSADIWRFVDGLPVLARRATFSYRASKFYRRNRVSVLAGAFVLISLCAGIAVAVSQAYAAQNQARIASDARQLAELETERAKSEEEKAQAEKEKAEKISRFMFKVIAYANPAWYAEGAKYGGAARVIDAVEDLSGKIDAEFAGQADVQAELHHKFAEVYNMVGRNEINTAPAEYFEKKRIFHALRAYELRKQFYGEHHELVAKDMFYAYGFLGKNEQEQSELLAKAIQMMRETNPQNLNLPYMLEAYAAKLVLPDTPQSHEPYRNAARPSTVENKYELGERYLREAIALFRFHYKEDNNAVYGNECVLAYVLAMQEKWTGFDEHFRVCKQGEERIRRTKLADQKTTALELIEKVLAEKKRN